MKRERHPGGRLAAVTCGAATGTLLAVGTIGAYEVPVHQSIAGRAYEMSMLRNSDIGFHLGLDKPNFNTSLFPGVEDPRRLYTPKQLIVQGVDEEDDGLKPLNHFYDPANDRALTALSSYKSIDWALAGEDDARDQEFGYEELKEHLYDGLTGTPAEYRRELAYFLKGMGHAIHHIQDMAQPEHARVDAHCKEEICKVIGAHDPSDYEKLTLRWMSQNMLGYGGYPVSRFSTPAEYWHNAANQGMADFSNRNFVTKDTNFAGTLDAPVAHPDFALPSPGGAAIETVDVAALPGFPAGETGVMQFLRVDVADENTGVSAASSHRTSTFSLFSPDLVKQGEDPLFTLNRYNYVSAADHLVPRATAYSTGFLDHALRGRMEISLPSEGVFAIRDQSELLTADDGFAKLKAKVKNVTPDIVHADGSATSQAMSGGTVVGVVRYRRNKCYEADLSGELNPDFEVPSGCSLVDWYVSDPYVAVSEEISLPAGIPEDGVELEFDFSDDVIPVNARDMVFQVVYRGMLGEEENAVAVSALDISEPTFVAYMNMTDLVWIDGRFYSIEDIEADPALQERLNLDDEEPLNDIDYLPETFKTLVVDFGGAPLATGALLEPGRYFRLAILTTTGAGAARVFYAHADDNIVRSQRIHPVGWQVNTNREPIIFYVLTRIRGTYQANISLPYKEIGTPPATNEDIWGLDPEYDVVAKDPVPMQVNF